MNPKAWWSALTCRSRAFRSAACAASNWPARATPASWWMCRAKTRTGCARRACSPWCAASWAAPTSRPTPASSPTPPSPTRPNPRPSSGIPSHPPLPDGAERPVLGGDVGAEVPRLLSAARDLLNNLSALSAPDAALGSSLAQIKTLTERLNGPGGALGVLLGNAADARQLPALLERSNAVLARLDALLARIDGMAARADRQ